MGRGKDMNAVRKLSIPEIELMSPGHVACQGCGATLAFRYALKALGRKTIVIIPACCWSVIDGPFPHSSAGVPLFHTAFETAASTTSGVKAALEVKGNSDVSALAWAGDGGTMDIGIQALSGAVERGDDIIYVCYDNEAYMNTGIQRSSSTPHGAWTTTTPAKNFKKGPKKNMVEIMLAHKIPYTATANIAFPEDFIAKLQKARAIKGPKFIQILSPCPVGWKFPSHLTIKVAKLAFETCIYPVYEVENSRYTIKRPNTKKPVKLYLEQQGRFRHLTDSTIDEIQENVDREWEILLNRESASHVEAAKA